jgi:hypothetical protein
MPLHGAEDWFQQSMRKNFYQKYVIVVVV